MQDHKVFQVLQAKKVRISGIGILRFRDLLNLLLGGKGDIGPKGIEGERGKCIEIAQIILYMVEHFIYNSIIIIKYASN